MIKVFWVSPIPLLTICLLLFVTSATAESRAVSISRAEGPKLAKATGHYARARALLVSAVREFDRATKIVNPDVLLDSQEWRNSLLDRAEDLERVLAPQARATVEGIRFEPDTRLLGEASR